MAPPKLFGPPKPLIQPGDLFRRVPFHFPLPQEQFFRKEAGDDDRLFRMFYEGELGGIGTTEIVAVRRRLVYAILDPSTPGCQINKVIPDDKERPMPAFSEDAVLTLLHCNTKSEIPREWSEKLKRGGHKRFGLLGDVELPDGKLASLAVSFRRSQQFAARDVDTFERIASPLDDAHEGISGADLILAAFEEYRTEGTLPNPG